jgi:methyltransferase (TIGR00027 family)
LGETKLPVRTISDTALWVAYFRARENERADALFRDPFAERLAGERGFQIAHDLREGNKQQWVWAARTYLCDEFVTREIAGGADLVLNLAAGLDARPYRMDLPESLRWVEVDLPEIISYKQQILARDEPKCRLERIALDLAQREERMKLFSRLDLEAKRVAVLAEGLLVYLTNDEAGSLARDLGEHVHFRSFILDLASPLQLRFMQWTMGKQLSGGGATLKFAPSEGPDFFRPYGWEPNDVQGLQKTAARFNRLPEGAPRPPEEPNGPMGRLQWSGVCLLHRMDSCNNPRNSVENV